MLMQLVLFLLPIRLYIKYLFLQGTCDEQKNGKNDEIVMEPSPGLVVIKKLVASIICSIIFVTMIPSYPMQKVTGMLSFQEQELNTENYFYK